MATAESCAAELLAGVPFIMRFLRTEMRRHRHVSLSLPQFRALIFARHSHDRSLSALAEHVGLSLPAASRMVELLVKRRLMQRRLDPRNRRCVSISLSASGRSAICRAIQATEHAVAQQFAALSARELECVSKAMQVLQIVFGQSRALRATAEAAGSGLRRGPRKRPRENAGMGPEHRSRATGGRRRPASV